MIYPLYFSSNYYIVLKVNNYDNIYNFYLIKIYFIYFIFI